MSLQHNIQARSRNEVKPVLFLILWGELIPLIPMQTSHSQMNIHNLRKTYQRKKKIPKGMYEKLFKNLNMLIECFCSSIKPNNSVLIMHNFV